MIPDIWHVTREKGLPDGAVLLAVDANRHILEAINDGRVITSYPVSTASAGLGEEIDSYRTPRGLHRICERIGEGHAPGSVFESRKFTGEILPPDQWSQGASARDRILSRILRLEGREPGVNLGSRVDSFSRMIYIHGTNQEQYVGNRSASSGCVRMRNTDVIALFDALRSQDAWVYIF